MLAVLEFIFGDFWHFIGICVLLMIITFWKPIDVTIMHDNRRKNDDD